MITRQHVWRLLSSSLLGLALVLLLGTLLPYSSQAQQDDSTCTGVDFVFLIDESGSMERNDQHQLRRSAVATAVDIIGDNAIYHCPGIVHRLAVIGFGGTSEGNITDPNYMNLYTATYVEPTTEISGTIENLSAWKTQRDEQIKSRIPSADQLGATDHLLAFKKAAEIIQQWKEPPAGTVDSRKKAVILITDGGPCINVVNNVCDWTETEFGSQDNYLKELEAYTDPIAENFPFRGENNPDSVFIWIIAFADSSIRGYDYLSDPALRNTWQRIAEHHGGKLFILERKESLEEANTEVTARVAQITDNLLNSELQAWPCDKPLWVLPYQNNVTILHVFKRGSDPGVRLEEVAVRITVEKGGQEVAEFSNGRVTMGTAQIHDYTREGPNERYVFYAPPPGKYSIQVDGASLCDDIDVEVGEVGIDAKVISPAEKDIFSAVVEPPYYDIVSPKQFVFQFLEPGLTEQEQPVKEFPDYPLRGTVTLQGKGYAGEEIEETYYLRLADPENAIYESFDPKTDKPAYIKTPFAGRYQWRLHVETPHPQSFEPGLGDIAPVTVLETSGAFEVIPALHFDFEIIKPRLDDLILAYDVKDGKKVGVPIPVEIRLIDEQGEPLDPTDVLLDEKANTFEVILTNADGVLIEKTQVKPKFGQSTLTTTLRKLPEGAAVDPPGTYEITVRLLGNYDLSLYLPVTDRHSLQFERTKVQPFTFSITSPVKGEILPLEEDAAPQPLTVSVQVLDEDNNPFSAQQFAAIDNVIPFEAILEDADGNLLDQKDLQLSADGHAFVAKLGNGSGTPQFVEGCYKLRILLKEGYKSEILRPLTQSLEQEVCMQLVQKMVWQVASPLANQTYTIHPLLRWFPDPDPLPIELSITNSKGEIIRGDKLLRPGKETLVSGRLHHVDSDVDFPLTFALNENGIFVAGWPQNANCPGTYELQVDLQSKNLSPAFRPTVPDQQTVRFLRRDSWLSQPWSLLALILLIIVILFDTWLLRRATGPLANAELRFKIDGLDIGSVNVSGTLNRRKYTAKRVQLDRSIPDLDLEKIQAETPGGNVNVTLYWPSEAFDDDEESYIDDALSEATPFFNVGFDEEIYVDSNTVMRLSKNRWGRFTWLTMPVFAALLLLPLLWAGVIFFLINRPPC